VLRDDDGPNTLPTLAAELNHDAGLAIITEGLLDYLAPTDVRGLWQRFATTLATFAAGRYISNLHLARAQTLEVRAFQIALAAFVRGRVYLHFEDADQAMAALQQAGFQSASVTPAAELPDAVSARGPQLAHILEASTLPSA